MLPPPSAAAAPLSTSGKVFFGGLCAGTFGLGVWQVLRLQEKTTMIEERDRQLSLEPSRELGGDEQYRRRLLSGVLRHDRQVLIGPRGAPPGVRLPRHGLSAKQKSGGGTGMAPGPQGYYVYTPLELSRDWEGSRKSVWVNRGWVPKTMVDANNQGGRNIHVPSGGWSEPQGKVELTAVRTYPEKPKYMTPEHDYSKRPPRLFYIDGLALRAMSDHRDEEETLIMTNVDTNEDNDKNKPIVYPVSPPVAMVGDFKTSPAIHVGYAATWFGLSGAGLYMTRKLILRGRG